MRLNLVKYYVFFTLFLSGAVVLVVEIAGSRVLAPFYGSTIFVWSSLITVTLGFLALGYLAGGFLADKHPRPDYFYFIVFFGGASALFLLKFSRSILSFSDNFGFSFGPLAACILLFALPVFLLSMAGPYVIRLRAASSEHSGHVAGTVFGISTLGSLFGALLTGFYLIPNFFLPDIFSVSLGILMTAAIAGLIFTKTSWRLIIFLIIILSLLQITSMSDIEAGVIYHEPSFYGDVRVVDFWGQRCLEVNSSSQTCVNLKTGASSLAYAGIIKSLLVSGERDGNLLIVGLGGGVLARDLKEKFNTVDVVEIDAKMIFAAEEFFGYNGSVYVADARSFIRRNTKKYDVIIIDAFSGANPPFHLYTKEAFGEMGDILSSNGLFLVNTLGRPFGASENLPRSLYKTLKSVFPYCRSLTTENIEKNPEALGNIIFVASFQPENFTFKKEFEINFNEIGGMERAVIFVDAKNPMEIWSAEIAGEVQNLYRQFSASGGY